MKIALIGKPKSGKSTVSNALSGLSVSTDKYAPAATEPNICVVPVLDERVSRLSEIYKPQKTIYANIEFRDYPGIFGGQIDSKENTLYNDIKTCEGFALVIRNFADDELDSLIGEVQPLQDFESFEEEMILNDLILAEKRLEKIHLDYKRGVKTPAIQLEEKVLEQICEHLRENKPLRTLELKEEEAKSLKGFAFFSAKPLMVILNSDEDGFGKNEEMIRAFEAKGIMAIEIAGRFEEELAKLEDEEAQMFMEDMGIQSSIKDRLIHQSYLMMGYISFFTVGEDEVRAWTIVKGDNALTAAGKIHSDLARGFIRAECFNYEQILEHGSEKVLKEKGLFRLEGKNYLVQDGEIVHIRFNV